MTRGAPGMRQTGDMKIGVLGTGSVGQAIGTGLVAAGHEVVMGARDVANPRAIQWAAHHTAHTSTLASAGVHVARAGTFADAARHAALVFNATSGSHSLDALSAAGTENLAGKVLVDVANPLDFSGGFPPRLLFGTDDSLAERIQQAFPLARVVKALNTVNATVMVDPGLVPGDHHVFIAGDDNEAKQTVTGILGQFGWPAARVMDLGGLVAARSLETYLLMWLAMMQAQGTATFNIQVLRGTG